MLTDDERNHLLSIADAVASLHAVDGSVRRDHCVAAAERIRDAVAPRVATVGELLATAPHGFVIEFIDSLSGAPFQIDLRDEAVGHRMYCDWWDREWCTDEIAVRWLKLPARLVPIADIDASPESRGPIGEG